MTAPEAPPAPEQQHTLTGDIRVHEGFRSRFLEHLRTVLVYLPPGYNPKKATRYPVLYLHDGQNIFDKATSIGEEWRVDETAQALIAAGDIEPLIIVGIYHAGEHRIGEYTPTTDPEKGGGLADRYGRMLVEELKPFVDEKYKTLPSAASNGLGGSSLGGLVTLHLGIKYPTVFSRLAVLSPSVWWDDRVVVKEVQGLSSKPPLKIWLDAGTAEGEQVTGDTRALRDALLSKGWVVGHDLQYLEAEGGQHNEQSWAARVDPMLRFLYPTRRRKKRVSEGARG
jgi:predicted alpha/beta superfamily hydrolase